MEAALVAQTAMTQKAIALSVIKQAADMQQKMAEILADAAAMVPAGSRGGMVNMTA